MDQQSAEIYTTSSAPPPPPVGPLVGLRPADVSVLCAHFGLPTPTPDCDFASIIQQRSLTPEDLYDQLSGTTSVPLMVAAHALVTGPRRLPPDPRLNPAPTPPCGGPRPPLRSGEAVPRPRYAKPPRTATDPAPNQVPPDHAVLVRVAPNPKKQGSKTWDNYEKYKIGMTVGELRKLGWRNSNLAWDISHDFVEFRAPGEPGAAAAPTTAARQEPGLPETAAGGVSHPAG